MRLNAIGSSNLVTSILKSRIASTGFRRNVRFLAQHTSDKALASKFPASSALLSREVLDSIKRDLVEADVNHDNRICFEELKLILHKYQDKIHFTDEEIDEIGDLFFVGLRGRSVKHLTFLRGIQHSVRHAPPEDNPLHLESIPDDRCWTAQSPAVDNASLYDIQAKFDEMLLRYVEDKISSQKSNDN